MKNPGCQFALVLCGSLGAIFLVLAAYALWMIMARLSVILPIHIGFK